MAAAAAEDSLAVLIYLFNPALWHVWINARRALESLGSKSTTSTRSDLAIAATPAAAAAANATVREGRGGVEKHVSCAIVFCS